MSLPRKHLWWLGAALLLLALPGAFRKAKGPERIEKKVAAAATTTRTGREHREKPRGRRGAVSRYSASCLRGLSAKEIREIAVEFEEKVMVDDGLPSSFEEGVEQRRRFHEWYLRSLVEGLGLSGDQETAAKARLDLLFEEALAKQREALGAKERGDGVPLGVERRFYAAQSWLKDDAYAPWELCELTEDQKGITWHDWLQVERKSNQETGDDPSPWFNLWIRAGKVPGSPGITGFPEGSGAKEFGDAGAIFPLHPRQNFQIEPDDPTLSELRGLNAAQLRTLLMLFPESLGKVNNALKNQ